MKDKQIDWSDPETRCRAASIDIDDVIKRLSFLHHGIAAYVGRDADAPEEEMQGASDILERDLGELTRISKFLWDPEKEGEGLGQGRGEKVDSELDLDPTENE